MPYNYWAEGQKIDLSSQQVAGFSPLLIRLERPNIRPMASGAILWRG